MSLFKLRGKLSKGQSLALGVAGFAIFILIWWGLAEALSKKRPIVDIDPRLPSSIVQDSNSVQINLDSLARVDSLKFANATEFEKVYPLLPTPWMVLSSYPDLYVKDKLWTNTVQSIWRNLQGYFWAVIISIPLGFIIGLWPLFRGLFSKQVDALRYLPLTALTMVFITWFGIEDEMKVAFLAFGIIVYLLPVVVQRIDEVNDVYLKTVFTLGARDWQTIRTVYFPSVVAKLMDDIRVLTAISWTYIIIAEIINRQGGIGSLIYIKSRQGQLEKQFAILFVIILIGFIQDRIFVYLDRRLFPHKYYKTTLGGLKEVDAGIYTILGTMAFVMFQSWLFPAASGVVGSLATILVIAGLLIIVYGEYKLRKAELAA